MKLLKSFSLAALALLLALTSCEQPDEPTQQKKFHTVEVIDADTPEILLPEGTADVVFKVYDAEVFTLSNYEVLLRKKGSTKSPKEVVLERIQPRENGFFSAILRDEAYADDYNFELTLDFKSADGTVVRSNPFRVCGYKAALGLKNFRIEKSLNPTLTKSVTLEFDPEKSSFYGATDNLLTNLTLIPSFEAEGKVTVGGKEQTSGVTPVDFSAPVTYTVELPNGNTATFKVELKNFSGLPVMTINTKDGKDIVSKDDWKDASISIYGAGRFEDIATTDVEIKGRGNSTWGYDKKPYALKFPSKTSVLGMPKHKRWVLLANTMDRTMMRNRVAYHIAEQTSLAWTPRTEFVEVFLNGRYIGNYLVAEQIRIDKNRINITEMESSDESGEAITGGYVYEMDFHFDNVNQWWTPRGFPSSIKFPDEDDITKKQLEWGKNYFNEVESIIYGNNFKDPATGYPSKLDVQSFVDYWLVYEICINHELANPGSVYMHKDRGGKLTAGPIWDFDWGTFSYSASPQAKGKLFMQGAIWYGRLFQDPAFKALAKERWEALYPKFVAVESFILAEYDYLGESAKKNFAVWNPATTGNINGDVNLSFDDAVEKMYDLYVDRVNTLNSIFATW